MEEIDLLGPKKKVQVSESLRRRGLRPLDGPGGLSESGNPSDRVDLAKVSATFVRRHAP